MSRWRSIAAVSVFMLGNWAATNVAFAQTFEERWSPIPRAHAEPNADPQPNPQLDPNAQVKPRGIQTRRPEPPEATSTAPSPGRPVARRVFTGRASYYAYHGGKTASGEPFRPHALTAAHRTLPFGARVRVTDIKTSKSVEVIITDRGPASRSRVLDLSLGAARALGIGSRGIIQVRAEIISGQTATQTRRFLMPPAPTRLHTVSYQQEAAPWGVTPLSPS